MADRDEKQGGETGDTGEGRVAFVKNKRKYLRGKITRSINRMHDAMQREETNRRRFTKELAELRSDYNKACEYHGELYSLLDESLVEKLDQWENTLINDVHKIEEDVEDYLSSTTGKSVEEHLVTESTNHSDNQPITPHVSPVSQQPQSTTIQSTAHQHESFDKWICDLAEFEETQLPSSDRELSVSDALFKLEAARDIPTITLLKFDGNPLEYVDFIERFKIHIHNKAHLTDDMRLIQLNMHVFGEAGRAISGLGSSGKMYATALKILREQFGQPSLIARAYINKLTKEGKIPANNRNALRDLSMCLINCIAVLKRLNYFADINANETLRRIVLRLPNYLIDKWKFTVAGIREKGESPTVEHISEFVRKRVRAEFDPDFGDLEKCRYTDQTDVRARDKSKKVYTQQSYQSAYKRKCCICDQGEHRVSECPKFADCRVPDRVNLVKEHKLCFSCLAKGHVSRECRSKKQCSKEGCIRTHNTLLHVEYKPPSASSVTSVLDFDSMLPMVRVTFRAANGKTREGNVLVDSGAGTTVIRRGFAKALGLQGKSERLGLSVVGGNTINEIDSRRLKFYISPLHGGEEFEIEAYEIEQTVHDIPALDRNWLNSFNHLKNLTLTHKAGPIDLILGVHYSHLHTEEEVIQGLPFEPVAKKIKLGWYVLGADSTKRLSSCSLNFVEKIDMQKFYDFETLGIQGHNCACPKTVMSSDDRKAMDIFEKTITKKENRYEIGLPWKTSPTHLPNNYPVALKRLESLERSLMKQDAKGQLYKKAIKEYESNGWAEKKTLLENKDSTEDFAVYYLPHHGVYRPDKPSTPLRVVFDPACLCGGVSLNSLLYKGPDLTGNLLGVLLRFREEEIAFSGDISKMFLQILLSESDASVHRFLWRDLDTSREPEEYKLLRVTFGDKSSPSMASYVMLCIAEENNEAFPDAATILRRDRYMDDLIHSCATKEQAAKRILDLNTILQTGSFRIKKWYCSAEDVDRKLASEQTIESTYLEKRSDPNLNESDIDVSLDHEKVKTLGLGWNYREDTLRFIVKEINVQKYTKRNVLSKMSMLYDPLGLATAVTIRCRIAMQDIWRCKDLQWDDPMPEEMCDIWQTIFREIEQLRAVEFHRSLKPDQCTGPSELHVFADASIKAYGAVAYLRWPTEGTPEVRLVSAKARVAPLHLSTIPRLELMAAVVASRLARTIVDEFKIKPSKVTLWTDSQIVLHWIRSESVTFKPFVGVRVAEIQLTWKPSNWKFVPTKQNPADDLSRGITVEKMTCRWIHGPNFLRMEDEMSEEPVIKEDLSDDIEERKPKSIGAVCTQTTAIEPENFSSWQRLLRVTAYCLRFINRLRCRVMKNQHAIPEETLQSVEISSAEEFWLKYIQRDLGNWKQDYSDLSPFVKSDIVRVGGRLRQSSLMYDQMHPILLPARHYICKLIMRDVHEKMGHVGPERTLCECRRKYWIARGRNMAKGIVRNCVVCRKLRQRSHSTLMGDLPTERLKLFSPPFSVTGVDLFGPFKLKYGRNKSVKAWGALFTCATMRAIHLEIVADLSTQAFLQALRRFAATYGWPTTIISDNGTSFVGTQKELRTLVQEGRKQIQDFAVLHRVKWVFITPHSPHQGGFYESLIKQTKIALKVAIGQQILSWNEMSTIFAEVKCLINSRPLSYMNNDPNDIQPLTPNHLLLGRATAEIPQGPFQETKNLHKRFEFVQMVVQQFWRYFIRSYLPTLQKRAKWRFEKRQLQVGDIVLIVDYAAPRGKWNLARIVDVYPGSDGIIRNVKVKTQYGEYKRSIQKCCPILERMDTDDPM